MRSLCPPLLTVIGRSRVVLPGGIGQSVSQRIGGRNDSSTAAEFSRISTDLGPSVFRTSTTPNCFRCVDDEIRLGKRRSISSSSSSSKVVERLWSVNRRLFSTISSIPRSGNYRSGFSSSSSSSFFSSFFSSSSSNFFHHHDRRSFSISAAQLAKSHYETLELTNSADPKEIKAAFYRLSKKYHPDLNPGDKRAEEMFKAVSAAYNVLGDATNKAQYDRDHSSTSSSSYSSSSTSGGRTRRDSGFSHESADWRYMDSERMMREQEEVWRRLREHEDKFGRRQANDFGFGHFGRTARPGRPPPPGYGTSEDRERNFEQYQNYRDRKFGVDRSRKRGWQNLTLGHLFLLSFWIGLALNILIGVLAPPDLNSPYEGKGR